MSSAFTGRRYVIMICIYQAEQIQILEACICHLLLYLNKIKGNKFIFAK